MEHSWQYLFTFLVSILAFFCEKLFSNFCDKIYQLRNFLLPNTCDSKAAEISAVDYINEENENIIRSNEFNFFNTWNVVTIC